MPASAGPGGRGDAGGGESPQALGGGVGKAWRAAAWYHARPLQ
jgi:hypothetical protein